ncbi:MAG: MFS transporter [Chloroflexi bacterium]|nr:MFS transporter [Chloroflexota bacterium]
MTRTMTQTKLPWFPWIGKRPFYGWVIVVTGTMVQFTTNISTQALGTYFAPLQNEFGWSRAVLAGPRSATQVENAVLGPIEGFLVDRLGPRITVGLGIFIMGLGLILFGFITSLWMYYLSVIIIALGTGFAGYLVLSVAINHWFRRKRSIANAVTGIGLGIAGTVIPVVVFTQVQLGWRTASILTGLLICIVGTPAILLLRRSPKPYGLEMDGETTGAFATASTERRGSVIAEHDFTLREALRTRAFWLLAIGQALTSTGMVALQAHVFLLLEQDVGLSRTTGALVWSASSFVSIPARLIGGFMGDRLPKNIFAGSSTAMIAISMVVLGFATSLPTALAFAILYGIGLGSRTPVMNALQGDYFGMRSQGVIRGWLALVPLPFSIAAPVVAGYMADVRGSYDLAFIALGLVVLVGAVLIFLATPPRAPARTEDIPGGQKTPGRGAL